MSSRSLLLVDTDPAVHDVLHDALRREDRQIHDVYDGPQALEVLRSFACDVVVAGQGRNGHDGLKLLRRMLAIRPEAKVIVAGEPDPAQIVGAIRRHAYSYIHKPLSPGTVAEMVQQALEASSWKDDIRVLSARPEWITLEIRCKMHAAERTTQFLRELEAGLPAQTRDDITSAFRELMMNAIEHGCGCDSGKRVRVSRLRGARSVMVHIHDPGAGFSLASLPHAAISNPDDEPTRHAELRAEAGQRPGGFGILMAQKLVDELLYNERGNSVAFVKYL